MPQVWISGELFPDASAVVPATDRAFQVGHGVFETVLALEGKPVFLPAHLARLAGACSTAYLPVPDPTTLTCAVGAVLASHPRDRLRVRIQVTPQTSIVSAGPAPEPEGMLDVVTVPWPRNERAALARVKAVSYAENIIALEYARRRGGREALIGNTAGHLCEGATSNVFAVFEGRLCTPPLSSGCLPGTARAMVIALCAELAIPISEEEIPMRYLSDRTEEMFVTSAVRIIQPVSRIDSKPVDRAPGRFAPLLRKAFGTKIAAEWG